MYIYGKNPVKELLSDSNSRIEEIIVSKDTKHDRPAELIKFAKQRGIKISFLSRDAISRISDSTAHQGIVARVADFDYADISHITDIAKNRGENLLLVILDHIEDPHNLGAIIRSANVLGAHGVVIPKDRAASVTPAVIKVASGATKHVPVAKVVNLAMLIKDLKQDGVWIVGADAGATPVHRENLGDSDLALVVGNEGKGLSPRVKKECDFLVSIPQVGKVSSLNASVAAGVLLYEIMRQRNEDAK